MNLNMLIAPQSPLHNINPKKQLPIEVWARIFDFYEVSNLGRVRGIPMYYTNERKVWIKQ